jgi:hypothetical protein
MPMMTTTTMISTKVKPLVRIRKVKEVEFIDRFHDQKLNLATPELSFEVPCFFE